MLRKTENHSGDGHALYLAVIPAQAGIHVLTYHLGDDARVCGAFQLEPVCNTFSINTPDSKAAAQSANISPRTTWRTMCRGGPPWPPFQ